ncbi:hypothetical protein [Dapis sp. BLCC M229]|uniref:hypothetical protein n=1 Tax=Dapis sp. BLCC M229 TaxID=3400188 RepID=UPI003CF24793
MVFLPLSAENANFLSLINRKAGTFLDKKRLKSLYVNAFMIIQQALNILGFFPQPNLQEQIIYKKRYSYLSTYTELISHPNSL